MSFKETFMSFTPAERQEIAEKAGTTIGYLNKHMYSSGGEPRFRLATAVNLDKASNGSLSLVDITEGEVDWNHVLKRLQAAKRKGLI